MLYSRKLQIVAGTSPEPEQARPRVELLYFFLPAIGFAGPLRVRALVWVR
jgi:hypothetical protein